MDWLWSRLEQPITDARSLRTRNLWLACIHLVLFSASVATLAVIASQLRLLVTLSQRSNVETLTLAIVAAISVFMILSTLDATLGGARLLYARAIPHEHAQRWLQERADRGRKVDAHSYTDAAITGPDGGPVEIPIADEHGELGTLRLDRTDIGLVGVPEGAATAVTQLVVGALGRHGRPEGLGSAPRVVFWDGIDEDASRAYFAQCAAFGRLETVLGGKHLWPRVVLERPDIETVRAILTEAAPGIREDLLMPDIQYRAEFSMPIVPEPLGFVQLRRQAQRADPVAAMGCSALMALSFLAVVAYVVISPPWVPGR